MKRKQPLFSLLGVLLLGPLCAPLQAESLQGAYNPAPRPSVSPPLLPAEKRKTQSTARVIELQPVSPKELEAMGQRRSRSKAHLIGFGRPLPSPLRGDVLSGLPWREHEDGSKSVLVSIRSPGAAALRAELDISRLPPGASFRYFALSAPEHSPQLISYDSGPSGAAAAQARSAQGEAVHLVWTPLLVGDTLGIELHLPSSADPKGLILPIPRVSHITESPLSPRIPKESGSLGSSTACQIDVACRNTPPWSTVKDAVAKVTFVDDGYSYLCTGTLLADQEEMSWIPYFLTANHCVNKPAAAATVNSFWFFQRNSCGGAVDWGTQLSAGAWLLKHGDYSDFSLLELAEPAPGGALFAGWNTDTHVLQSITGLHHPSGDVKKISFGHILGTSNCRESGNCGFNDLNVTWSEGHTETGSSGSGIFSSGGKLLGTLWGGSSYCSGGGQVIGNDAYGRFADTLPQVKRFLALKAEKLAPGRVVAGHVDEGGWRDYRLDIGDSTYSIEVILHQLSSDAGLYVRQGSKPTSDSFQCAPQQQGRSAEFCTLWVTPGDVVYLSVFGTTPADYHLTINASWISKDLAQAGGSLRPPTRRSPYSRRINR